MIVDRDSSWRHLRDKSHYLPHIDDVINKKDANGMTPIIYACFVGFDTFAEYLLRTGKKKKIKYIYRNMYSHYAAKNKMPLGNVH